MSSRGNVQVLKLAVDSSIEKVIIYQRFILGMDSNAILARIYDGEIWPEVNGENGLIHRQKF